MAVLMTSCAIVFFLCLGSPYAQAAQVGFSRIIHGWTNYSTAFNATENTSAIDDLATVATFYTPTNDVRPIDFGIIAVWLGSSGQRLDFNNFTFALYFWSSLEAFTNNPQRGDLAVLTFASPSGGSTTLPDTVTRGGRAAYELRFCLTNASLMLEAGHTYLVGWAARTSTSQFGELYVPTSSHDGASDVQAGTSVIGGWQYLVDSGGSTIYSGELADELIVQPVLLPSLTVERVPGQLRLSWPTTALGFVLESVCDLAAPQDWQMVPGNPTVAGGENRLWLPLENTRRYFRLKRP